MSELNVDTINNSAGTHERFPCTAWVNFNGTGTVAIRDSGNVSSITDGGVGIYDVNLTTALDNSDYAAACTGGGTASMGTCSTQEGSRSRTVSLVPLVMVRFDGTSGGDTAYLSIAIFGGLA